MIGALQARLADSLARAQETDESLAVLHVALERPLTGTPSWAGGELTTLLIGALRGVVRVTDSVLCADAHEAWILLPGCDFDGAAGAADRTAAALDDLGPAVGIAIFPDHSAQPSWLARHAELASVRARNAGSAFAFAEPQDNDPPGASLIHELPAALREKRLLLHYQPQFELATRRLVGVEALVRWDHPERGILEPAAFLPLAQMTRLGVEVDLEVLRFAARQTAGWRRAGRVLPVAVKLHGRTLMMPGLLAELRAILRRTGADAQQLKLEVREETVTNVPRAPAVIDELRSAGVQVTIEHFGSGAASLSALERLEVDQLKLDPDLVRLARDSKQVGALASLVAGAHALGVRVCAPNLDSEQLVRATQGLGCELGQGFALGRPVPAAELPEVGGVQISEVPAAAGGRGSAKVLRLPQLGRPAIGRLRPPVSGGLLRLGSAAALVAAGILAGSVPFGGNTLGGVVAGYVTAPATALLGAHPNPAAKTKSTGGGAAGQPGTRAQAGGGAGGSSTGAHAASTGSTGGTSSSASSSSGSAVPLPLPSIQLPTPIPTPSLPLPTASPNLLP